MWPSLSNIRFSSWAQKQNVIINNQDEEKNRIKDIITSPYQFAHLAIAIDNALI